MNAEVVGQIWRRARYRCEYCHLPQSAVQAPFQIDHIIARQHGGSDDPDNLALCCVHCNRYKGPNIAGIVPKTGEVVRLFHPRRHVWTDHFRWSGAEVEPLTPAGRVTIQVLFMNDPEVVYLRRELMEEGTFHQG